MRHIQQAPEQRLTICNNQNHPALNTLSRHHLLDAENQLSAAILELRAAYESLAEYADVIRITELVTALQIVNAYRHIIEQTLQIDAARPASRKAAA